MLLLLLIGGVIGAIANYTNARFQFRGDEFWNGNFFLSNNNDVVVVLLGVMLCYPPLHVLAVAELSSCKIMSN